jgi:hypothetical protein
VVRHGGDHLGFVDPEPIRDALEDALVRLVGMNQSTSSTDTPGDRRGRSHRFGDVDHRVLNTWLPTIRSLPIVPVVETPPST